VLEVRVEIDHVEERTGDNHLRLAAGERHAHQGLVVRAPGIDPCGVVQPVSLGVDAGHEPDFSSLRTQRSEQFPALPVQVDPRPAVPLRDPQKATVRQQANGTGTTVELRIVPVQQRESDDVRVGFLLQDQARPPGHGVGDPKLYPIGKPARAQEGQGVGRSAPADDVQVGSIHCSELDAYSLAPVSTHYEQPGARDRLPDMAVGEAVDGF